jgi:retron-type reverse transcriptase
MHHIYHLSMLRAAYYGLKRDAAPGVDGETWRQYGEELESNLADLSGRLRRGAYRAKPVRRVFITKEDGRQRPLGVTALEDKIVQRATVEVLNAIYETDFLGFSYGIGRARASTKRWMPCSLPCRSGWTGCWMAMSARSLMVWTING